MQHPSGIPQPIMYICGDPVFVAEPLLRVELSSHPGHVGGGKSGLVSTVCACANGSRNFSQTSLIMDKLHMVVMRRNNQTRYTACSVAAVLTRR